MKNHLAVTGILFFLYSCSSTNLMSLSVTEPAPVSIAPSMKSAVVVNRSRAADESKTVDAIHRTLSLETKDLQADGAKASVRGLTDELLKDGRFASVKSLDNLDLRSYGAGIFPTYLSWDTVEKICGENHADVLFSLELFDAAAKVGVGGAPALLSNPLGAVAALEQPFSMNTRIRTGWRIYDPATRNILDEFIIYRDLVSQGHGVGPVSVSNSLLVRKEAVNKAGIDAGQEYGLRIVPYSVRVSRWYYVRGNSSFIVARRMAQSGDWDDAAKLWQQQTESHSRKVAGRACYNMAIISEINGDLNAALDWSKKAYEMYNNRLALSYTNILRDRQNNNEVLKSQTEITGP
ncbi:MAG TPA: DUF6340 family protein [Puia sp.]|nr:DUF6340 family protein [Puia sp.]